MNHDYSHCLDYDPARCPPSCFRAELTQDYYNRADGDMAGVPVSWMSFLGGPECLRGWKNEKERRRRT